MQDSILFEQIQIMLNAGMAAYGIAGTELMQGFEPTQQGINSGPTIYVYKLGPDRRIGSPKIKDVWDVDAEKMVHTELQVYESDFQISTLVKLDPKFPDMKTASDLANLAAAIIQGDAGRKSLRAAGIGILRVTQVRNPYFKDSEDQFSANPSFDFTLTHKQVIILESPAIETTEFNITRV